MADTSVGMSENPFGCTSLQSRLLCAKCGVEPRLKNGASIEGGGPYNIVVTCHGEEDSKVVERKDLVFTQTFFDRE
jgi:hypothetical protein